MLRHLRSNLWLLALTVLIVCFLYPAVLLVIGQTLFPEKADGSLVLGGDGRPVGSRLIAQPFTADEYFQPRPSAVSYNAAASGGSNWGASNYLLRDRVARQLGPLVKYASGPKKGQPVAPDIERWFREDRYQGQAGIVARWAQAHPALAQNWVKADPLNAAFVEGWQKSHAAEVAQWVRDNPDNPQPKPEDLAVAFFTSYSRERPGTFPAAVAGKLQPLKSGPEIQGIFFDLWRQDHPQADLEQVPADMVMASGSGLDPHITLKSALYQLDRVAGAWAGKTKSDPTSVRQEIEGLVRKNAVAPLGGLAGVELVNVLEVNVFLRDRFASPATKKQGR